MTNLLFQSFLASSDGLSEAITWLTEFKTTAKEGSLLVIDIIKYLCAGAAAILAIALLFADKKGTGLGFEAGRYIVGLALVSGAIFIGQKIFGLS